MYREATGGVFHPIPSWANLMVYYVIPFATFGVTWTLCAWGRAESMSEARRLMCTGMELGFQWSSYVDIPPEHVASRLMLVYPGTPKKCRRLLQGNVHDTPVEVIQFVHHVRESDTATPRPLAVARESIGKGDALDHVHFAIRFPESIANLPDFNLTPVDDIDYWFKRYIPQDRVNWSTSVWDKQLNNLYFLGAIRPNLLKQWFTLDVVRQLVQNPGWNIQSREGRLIMWRVQPPKQRLFDTHRSCSPIPLDSLSDTVASAISLYRLLAAHNESSAREHH